jgi:hypothetical protein
MFNNIVWNAINQLNCNTSLPMTLNGNLQYANTAGSAMAYSPLELVDSTGTVVDRDTSRMNGSFSFNAIQGRRYRIRAFPTLSPGGINATDALRVVQSFSGSAPLTGLQAMAADVNRSGTVTSTDALNIARWSAQLLTSFPAGAWAQDTLGVLADTAAGPLGHRILSTGDVNSSYIPPPPPPPSPLPTSSATDGARNVYPTLGLQNQCWMGSNLLTNRFAYGDFIPFSPNNGLKRLGLSVRCLRD